MFIYFDFCGMLVLGTSIWVLIDSLALQGRGARMMHPGWWFLWCLLLWIVFFPLYLMSRGNFLRQAELKKRGTLAARITCPECGESIPRLAKSCHYCRTIITTKDRKPTRSITRRRP